MRVRRSFIFALTFCCEGMFEQSSPTQNHRITDHLFFCFAFFFTYLLQFTVEEKQKYAPALLS